MSADLVRITASSAGAIAMAGACLLVGGFALGFACALWADNVSQRRAASRDLRYVAPPAPRPNPTLWS
ncbi:hypothetical protein N789_14100 [Arenimonas oryziterrae DSM 21050 = YC6267]|uniref:Uncharacterized protein n=2 Tax=Arenimonas TaxID=490567 RepID=A0A091ASH8_9GAMM|nr:hypothetical protein N789_14100 [Arenimonas oryziterrae DSM 21050 = YC6267]